MIRNILILFIFILSSNTIFSQKCVSEEDPFTKEQVLSFNFRTKTVYFEHKNNKTTLEIDFNYWGERSYQFDQGTKILIKLKDGNTIELKSLNKSDPKIENVVTSNGFFTGFGSTTSFRSDKYTVYSFSFLLSSTELNKLAQSQVEIIRIPDTDKGKFVDLKAKGRTKKKTNAIYKGAICISERI